MAREGVPVGSVRRARGVVESVRVTALPGCELRPHLRPGPTARRGERVVIGEVEDTPGARQAIGNRLRHPERLIARRECGAAAAAAPEEIEAPEVEIGGTGDRGARSARPFGHDRESLRARDADVPQGRATAIPRDGEILRVLAEERPRQQLDHRVSAALDVETAPVELGDELGDDPLCVVRVPDEEHPGGAALRHPVDERHVGGQPLGQPLGHRVVPGGEVRGVGAARERRAGDDGR